MKNRSFVLFLSLLAFFLFGLSLFLESAPLAHFLNHQIQKRIPPQVRFSFASMKVQFFPPALVLSQVQAHLKKTIGMFDSGSHVQFEKVSFRFYPFQLLGKPIRWKKVLFKKGKVVLKLSKKKTEKPSKKFLFEKKQKSFSFRDFFYVKNLSFQQVHWEVHWGARLGVPWDAFYKKGRSSKQKKTYFNPKTLRGQHVFVFIPFLKVQDFGKHFLESIRIQFHLRHVRYRFQKRNLLIQEIQAMGKIQKGDVFIQELIAKHRFGTLRFQGKLKRQGLIQGSVDAIMMAPFFKILKNFGVPIKTKMISGAFRIQIQGKWNLWENNGKGSFQVLGEKAKLLSWKFALLKGKGTFYKKRSQHAKLKIKSFMFQSMEGGTVQVQPFQMQLPLGGAKRAEGKGWEFKIPLVLAHAPLQWLVGPAQKDLDSLKTKVSGTVRCKVLLSSITTHLSQKTQKPDRTHQEEQKWVVQVTMDLSVPKVVLKEDPRSTKSIFYIQKAKIQGTVLVQPKGVFVKTLTLFWPKSQFQVRGKVSFHDGYDLSVEGRGDFQAVKTLAGVPLEGKGLLHMSVQGLPDKEVQLGFQLRLKNARYLDLFLGDLKGRIVVHLPHEQKGWIAFENMSSRVQSLHYRAHGKIDFRDPDPLQLYFQFVRGDWKDLQIVFHSLVKQLPIFPKDLQGNIQGTLFIGGAPKLSQLRLRAHVWGDQWKIFQEHWDHGKIHFQFKKNIASIPSFWVRKKNHFLKANARFYPNGKIKWNLESDAFDLGELQFFQQRGVPLEGKIEVQSHGTWSSNQKDGMFLLQIYGLRLFGRDLTGGRVLINLFSDQAECFARFFRGRFFFETAYAWKQKSFQKVKLFLKKFDLRPLLLLVAPSLLYDRSFQAEIDGGLDLRLGDAIEGKIFLKKALLQGRGFLAFLKKPVFSKVQKGLLKPVRIQFEGPGTEVGISAQIQKKGSLQGRVNGKINLQILKIFLKNIQNVQGFFKVQGVLNGTLQSPSFQGGISLRARSLKIVNFYPALEQVQGNVSIQGSDLKLLNVQALLGGGKIQGQGILKRTSGFFPDVHLRLKWDHTSIRVSSLEKAVFSGVTEVIGHGPPYRIGGVLWLEEAKIGDFLKNTNASSVEEPVQRFMPPSERSIVNTWFAWDLHLKTRHVLEVHTPFLEARLRGAVKVQDKFLDPTITGALDLVDGSISFKDHVFQMRSGRIVFEPGIVLDPKFHFSARTKIRKYQIDLFVSGKASRWKADFSSNPPLPPADILNMIALGYTTSELEQVTEEEKSVVQQGEAASLLLYSVEFLKTLEKKTGFQVQLLESSDQSFSSTATRGTVGVAGPKVMIRKRLGKKVGISVGSTVGVGDVSEKVVRAEVEFSPVVSLMGVWNTVETISVQSFQNSYGVDLMFQKRFR